MGRVGIIVKTVLPHLKNEQIFLLDTTLSRISHMNHTFIESSMRGHIRGFFNTGIVSRAAVKMDNQTMKRESKPNIHAARDVFGFSTCSRF